MEVGIGRKDEGGGKREEGWKKEEGEIWVKKWVDYSNKYGLGYLLTNGATGVFFNDNTKIVLEPKGRYSKIKILITVIKSIILLS